MRKKTTTADTTAKPKGLFARLFGDNAKPSVADVDAEIAWMEEERRAITDRLAEVDRELVETWKTDEAAVLEDEAVRLRARERAASAALSRLIDEREMARRREFLAAYERDCRQAAAARDERERLRSQLKAAREAYDAARSAFARADDEAQNLLLKVGRDDVMTMDTEERKVLGDDMDAIRFKTGLISEAEFHSAIESNHRHELLGLDDAERKRCVADLLKARAQA